MRITIGTFNLNNLFSRYNFYGEIDAISSGNTEVGSTIEYHFADPNKYTIRKYLGNLVKGKPQAERDTIAQRIMAMDVDVLAVQEVEDIDTLKRFNIECLGRMYDYQVLIEGNDERLIDLGVLSKYPIGSITSWKEAVHTADPGIPVFGRDLLELEIWNTTRRRNLFTLYNNNLKSHFVPYNQDPVQGALLANQRRQKQAEVIAQIVEARMRPNSSYIILGDMNDPPNSQWLDLFVSSSALNLQNALTNPVETRPPKADNPMPASSAWTHRYKPSGQPAQYELYDQIWLSPALANKQTGQWVDRRKNHGGDGSDHDPAWIELDL
jgi:endonuclease/exonuclease/phosphatase family metal-dependent hydrolase